MHLRYDIWHASMTCGMHKHPVEVMRELDITYQRATPQSIAEQWWFWNCEGVPEPLPAFLTPLELDPSEAIGYGLNKDDAEAIKKGMLRCSQSEYD